MRRLTPFVAIASLVTLMSCDLTQTVVSPPSAPITGHRSTAADVDPGFSHLESPAQISVFLGVASQFNSNFAVSGLGPYPTPTVVTVAATGLLELRWVGGFALPPAGSLAGAIDPGGRRTGFNNDGCTEVSMVRILYIPPGQTGPIITWRGCQDGLRNNFSGNALVSGSVIIGRSPDGLQLIPGRCGGQGFNPCFTYHAGHNVTLTRVSAEFFMEVVANEIEPGQSAHFLTLLSPVSIGQMTPGISQSVATPFTPLEWRYIPDDEALDEVVVTACSTARNCTYAPAVSGTMRLTAVVNGDVQAKEQHVEVGSEKVEITPIPDRMPTITLPPGSACDKRMIFINERNIRVRVTRSNGTPVAGRQVKLTLGAYDNDGGHLASGHATPRPWGSIPQDVLTTDASGNGVVLWTIPEFSGRIGIKAELVGGSGQSDSITVKVQVPGFVELPVDPLYQRVGIITETHPQSHFGLPGLIPEIRKLAVWARPMDIPIGINDMSLPLGGRFDVAAKGEAGGQWMNSPHHCSHRNGNAFDFRTKELAESQRRRVLAYWKFVLKHSAYPEGDHDHLKLPPETRP